jgi:hypothetical protein
MIDLDFGTLSGIISLFHVNAPRAMVRHKEEKYVSDLQIQIRVLVVQ